MYLPRPLTAFATTNLAAHGWEKFDRKKRTRRSVPRFQNHATRLTPMERRKTWGSGMNNDEAHGRPVSRTWGSSNGTFSGMKRIISDTGKTSEFDHSSAVESTLRKRARNAPIVEISTTFDVMDLDCACQSVEPFLRLCITGPSGVVSTPATFSPSNEWNIIRRDFIEDQWLEQNLRPVQSDVPSNRKHLLFIPEGEVRISLRREGCSYQVSLADLESRPLSRFIVAPIDAPCEAVIGSNSLSEARHYVLTGPDYFLPCTPENTEELISSVVQASWNTPVECSFEISWELQEFLKQERTSSGSIGDMVTLTGSSDLAWACKCSEYLEEQWPDIATPLLGALDTTHVEDEKATIRFSGTRVSVTCKDLSRLIAIGKALGWLCAALRPSVLTSVCTSSVLIYQKTVDENATIYFYCCPLRVISEEERLCWNQLFPGGILAQDFPILPRPNGIMGLEIDFQSMAYLSGVQYAVVHEDRFSLKGSRTMLEPRWSTQGSIQWHFEPDYKTVDPSLQPQRLGSDFDDDSILNLMSPSHRHFLGLWHHARITLGTDHHDYSSVRWSEASEIPRYWEEDTRSFGMNFPGAHWVPGFTFTSTWKAANGRSSPFVGLDDFKANLLGMKTLPAILYCPSEKRGWMVSSLSVILHMVYARGALEVKHNESAVYTIPYAEAKGDGGEAAHRFIMKHKDEPLVNGFPGTLQGLVKAFMFALNDLKVASSMTAGQIWGYEFMDIAAISTIVRLKKSEMKWTVRSGWTHLLDSGLKVLLCEGINDVIIPDERKQNLAICDYWDKVPTGFEFLAASVPCLKDFAEYNGGNVFRAELRKDLVWHLPRQKHSCLFENCTHSSEVICSRAQELHSKLGGVLQRRPTINQRAHQNGAVLFKRSQDAPRNRKDADRLRANESRLADLKPRLTPGPQNVTPENSDPGHQGDSSTAPSTQEQDEIAPTTQTDQPKPANERIGLGIVGADITAIPASSSLPLTSSESNMVQ